MSSRRSPRGRILCTVPPLVAALCLALFASACSGGDASAGTAPTTSDPRTAAAEPPTTTTGPPETTRAPETTTTLRLAGVDFCAMAVNYDAARSRSELFSPQETVPSPAELESQWAEHLAYSDQLLAAAPAEISEAVALTQEPLRSLAALYEELDWDAAELATDLDMTRRVDLTARLDSAAIDAARAEIDGWILANCPAGTRTQAAAG